jgi:MFS family permease
MFTERQIQFAAFIGGPVAAGILLTQNYYRLQKRISALIALLLTIGVCVLLFKLAISYNGKTPPNLYLLPIINLLLVTFIFKFTQAKQVKEYVEAGYARSWTNAGAYVFLGMGVTLFAGVALTVVYNTPFFKKVKYYNETRNNVTYEQGNFTDAQAESIGTIATQIGYFTDKSLLSIWLEKKGSTITINVKDYKESFDDVYPIEENNFQKEIEQKVHYKQLLTKIKPVFPDSRVVLVLENNDHTKTTID